MTTLTPEGRRIVDEVAQRHYVSSDAAVTLLNALSQGGGTQAQFNHYELGGMGQWSRGGMIMIGDMFNNGLKFKVDALCNELSDLLNRSGMTVPTSFQSQSQSGGGYSSFNSNGQSNGQFNGQSSSQSNGQSNGQVSLFVSGGASGNWWPEELGYAASLGSQNDLRYAYFPQAQRLAINQGGKVTVYDSGNNQIGGFSQQQGGDQSLTFTSQYGLVRVADLPVVGAKAPPQAEAPAYRMPDTTQQQPTQQQMPQQPELAQFAPVYAAPETQASQDSGTLGSGTQSFEVDIFAKIERLAELRKKDILTQAEFETKKAELLARI